MKTLLLLIVCFNLTILPSFAQSKWNQSDYLSLTYRNFRSYPLFNDTLNIDSIDIPLLDAVIYYVTNEIRVEHKLSTLPYSPQLEATARMHSKDMAEKKFFSHINKFDKKKRDPNARARLNGVWNPFLAENIAETFCLRYQPNKEVYTPGPGKFSYKPQGELIRPHTYLSLAETLLTMWMNSPDHRKNILSPDAVQLGCGVYMFLDKKFNEMPTVMATQNFQWYVQINTTGNSVH